MLETVLKVADIIIKTVGMFVKIVDILQKSKERHQKKQPRLC